MSLTFQPFAPVHLDSAAALLAARHRAVRTWAPELDPAFEAPDAALTLIQEIAAGSEASGVAAFRGDRMVGYLIGAPEIGSPTQPFAGVMLPRSASIGYAGHAVEPGEEDLYARMYGILAGPWIDHGLMGHYVTVSADATSQEPWSDLGFGRCMALAIRPTAPDGRPAPAIDGLEIRRATPDDADAMQELAGLLLPAFVEAPVFIPYPPEARAAGAAMVAAHLADPGCPFWVASVRGRPASVQLFVEPTSPMWHQPAMESGRREVYLFIACTLPDMRATGIGAALFAHALAWARDAGYDTCSVNYFTAARSTQFWRGMGFRPVTYWMRRILDDRITWARG